MGRIYGLAENTVIWLGQALRLELGPQFHYASIMS